VQKGAKRWVAVSDLGFYGASGLTLDGKGRFTVPARHREELGSGELTITKHPDGCLLVMPRAVWQPFRDKVAALPMESVKWKRMFLGFASDVVIDGAQRVMVAPELRAYAGISRDLLLVGMGNHFELWDAGRYQSEEDEARRTEMPDTIKGFTF
jgi:MraZ protein